MFCDLRYIYIPLYDLRYIYIPLYEQSRKLSIKILFTLQMGMTQQEAGASVTPEESGKTLSKILQLGNIITAGNGKSLYLNS